MKLTFCKSSDDSEYNSVTLQPKDKEESKRFWNFRIDDIAEMLIVPFIFSALLWLIIIINFFDEIYLNPGVILLRSLHTLLLFVSWYLGTKYKQHLWYMTLIIYILAQILNAKTIEAFTVLAKEKTDMM